VFIRKPDRVEKQLLCSQSNTSSLIASDFSYHLLQPPMYPNLLLNFRIFAAQISVRQNRHYRNLDAELIDFIKINEKLQHLI
jgi:hypothetical protein